MIWSTTRPGEIYIEAGDEVTGENLELLDKAGIDRIELLDIDHVATGPWIRNTLKADKAEEREQALSDIYRVMRPGEPPTLETAESLFSGLFFDPDRYDLSAVGRVKLNMRPRPRTSRTPSPRCVPRISSQS